MVDETSVTVHMVGGLYDRWDVHRLPAERTDPWGNGNLMLIFWRFHRLVRFVQVNFGLQFPIEPPFQGFEQKVNDEYPVVAGDGANPALALELGSVGVHHLIVH